LGDSSVLSRPRELCYLARTPRELHVQTVMSTFS